MVKAIAFIGIFVIFLVLKLIIMGTKTAIKASREAYDAVENGGGVNGFIKGMTEGTPHAIIGMLTKVAKSDGRIDDYEAIFIRNTIDALIDGLKKAGMPYHELEKHRQSLIQTYNAAKENNYGVVYYAKKIDDKSNNDFMESIIAQLVMISFIAGLTSRKEAMVHEAAQILGVSIYIVNSLIESIKTTAQEEKTSSYSSDKDPWEILGVNRNDSFETVKKAYRELVKKFHPDNIQSQGLDEEFMHFAKARMQEINGAYEKVKAYYA